jgi:glycosyltransferase involved in cell wall biosynthesis
MKAQKNFNILIISAVFPPEPVVSANLSYDIASTLSENNEVTVISPKPSRPLGFKFDVTSQKFTFNHIISNSIVCPVSSIYGRLKESYSFGKFCFSYINDNYNNIDVIYANTWPLLGQYFVIKAAKKFKIPVILHVQDIYPESLTNKIPVLGSSLQLLLLPLDKYLLRNSNRIIAISNKMRNHLVKSRAIEMKKINVVQNWQDESVFINSNTIFTNENAGKHPFTFMYLGNIGPVAGVELLVEAFSKSKLSNCRLIIAGSGSKKESIQKRVLELNLQSVEFWIVPSGKVPETQRYADILILPVKKGAAMSSVPSKLPAYMFSSKPIMACVDEDSDTAETIISANCGWILAPENEDGLSQMMKMVVKMPLEELQQRGKNGFDFAIANFSKRKNLKKLCDIITEVI